MDRIAYVYRVKQGKLGDYIRAHEEIWPEMRDLLAEAGVRRMTIFSRGDLLFLYADVENLERYFQVRKSSEVARRWDEYMNTMLVSPFDAAEAGAFARLKEIWHFEVT